MNIKNPLHLYNAINENFEDLGKKAFNEENFDFIKWIPLIATGMLWILPGMLWGPIGLAIAVTIGAGGYFVIEKLMKFDVVAKFANKPLYALELVENNQIDEAIDVYNSLLDDISKVKSFSKKLDNLPDGLKEAIFKQIGHEITAKDYYVYEAGLYFAIGLLHEHKKELLDAEAFYEMSLRKCPISVKTAERLTLLVDKENRERIISTIKSCRDVEYADLCSVIEILQGQEDIVHLTNVEKAMKFWHQNDDETALMYTALHFDSHIRDLNDIYNTPPVEDGTKDFYFNILKKIERNRELSEYDLSKLHRCRKVRNKVLHNDYVTQEDKDFFLQYFLSRKIKNNAA